MQAVVDSPVEGKLSPSQLNMFEGFSYGTRNVLVTDQRVGHSMRRQASHACEYPAVLFQAAFVNLVRIPARPSNFALYC